MVSGLGPGCGRIRGAEIRKNICYSCSKRIDEEDRTRRLCNTSLIIDNDYWGSVSDDYSFACLHLSLRFIFCSNRSFAHIK